MTEEEAKTKWCPMSGAEGKKEDGSFAMPCITSDCMMWRWSEDKIETQLDRPVPCRKEDGWSINNIGWNMVEYARIRPNRKGYCGLGGTP